MELPELYRRIESWEDLHTEFKLGPIHPDDLASSLVAFANTDGGQLIFGIASDKTIQGISEPDRWMRQVDQIAYQNCEPPIMVIQETLVIENKVVVIVNIPKGDQRPYRTNRGDYFIRTTSGRRRASRQELLRLFQASESLYYDETLVIRASLADLNEQRFEQFFEEVFQRSIRESGGFERLLKNLRLIREYERVLYPTVASILFFGREPQRFLPQSHVSAARIVGDDLSTSPADAKQINGTLSEILEDTVRFLRIHLRIQHSIKGYEPETFPEIPEEALREFLVNALAHRDYTITAPVRVFIFDSRLEIRTPGGLPNTVTIEAIRLGAAHVLRNPTVYTLFSRWGLVTGIGTGVYRAIRLIREKTGREPDLSVIENEFVVSIYRQNGG